MSMVKYRILERRTNSDWVPFGVAYERDGRVVLFSPPWRADRTLAVATLEDLDQRHCPSTEFQWRAVKTTEQPVSHPIEWLQRALDDAEGTEAAPGIDGSVSTPHGERPVETHITKERSLAVGLERLEVVRPDLRARLIAWRKQMTRSNVPAEAVLSATLTAGQILTVGVLPALSHPSLRIVSSRGTTRTSVRRRGGKSSQEGRATGALTIRTDGLPSASVTVEEDTIMVIFLNWQALVPPLVVLVPEDSYSMPRVPDSLDRVDNQWTARFTGIPNGTYLLVIAPVSA
jgi:hypothetical protein